MRKKLILMALVFVLLAVPAGWLQLRDGVMMDGKFFAQKNDGLYANGDDCVSISRTDTGAAISIIVDDEQLDADLTIEEDLYSFIYSDGRTVQGYAGRWLDELVDADGAPIWLEDSIAVRVENAPEPSALTREYTLSNILYHMVEGICEQRGHALALICALLIYALGIASIFWPEEVHFFGARWAYSHAELSDAGIAVQRISGIACMAVGVGLLYAPLFW